jgi:hypothetical protein
VRKWCLFIAVFGLLTLGVPLLAGADSAQPTGAYAESDFFATWPGAVLLHIERSPAASGYVRSDPYYLDCPNACTRPFDPGQKVTLWAYPSSGPDFSGWSGDLCAGQGNPCVATIAKDSIVTANFTGAVVPPVTHTHELTILNDTASGATITLTPPGAPSGVCLLVVGPTLCYFHVVAGTHVTLTYAGAFSGAFSWLSGGCTGFVAIACHVTMDQDKFVSAG